MEPDGTAGDVRGPSPVADRCAVGELAVTGMAGGAALRQGGWFDPDLIHSSAESLH